MADTDPAGTDDVTHCPCCEHSWANELNTENAALRAQLAEAQAKIAEMLDLDTLRLDGITVGEWLAFLAGLWVASGYRDLNDRYYRGALVCGVIALLHFAAVWRW